jgi:type IV pilus assembly protein PilQ
MRLLQTLVVCIGALCLLTSGWADEGAAAAQATAPVTETAAAPASAESESAMDGIVIEYIEADIQNVLRTLAAKAGVNLILGDEVTGKVTVHLENVSYEEAMKLIVESKGYAYVKDARVVKVKSRDALETEPIEVKIFTLNYAKADDVKKTLEPVMSKQGRLQVDARSNTIIVSDTPSSLAQVVPLIERLDTQTPQVMIEAKFVETTKNPKKDLGINWSETLLEHEVSATAYRPAAGDPAAYADDPRGGPLLGFNLIKDLNGGPWSAPIALLNPGDAKVVFSFLSSDSDTELLANPRVVTTDNGKAKIAIATQYPIPSFTYSESAGSFQINGFEYKDIGIVLNVTPRINKNEFVTLEVTPEASSQSGVARLASGGSSVDIPVIDARIATTTVLIKSGNTLAIGGLMRQDTTDKYTKVPIMGDLPGVGALFRSKSVSKSKRDLLIFLTPTIVTPESQTGYEKYYGGIPAEELYANDKWMPRDNAKARDLFKNVQGPARAEDGPKPLTTNFKSK